MGSQGRSGICHLVTLSPCHLVRIIFSLLLCFPAVALAKEPPPLAPPPPEAPAVALRILAPSGAKATFYSDCRGGVDIEVPARVAVRPGYIYRFRLSNLPQGKDAAIYPTVEVIGSLRLPPPLCCPDFPVPIVISEEDINQVLAGGYITKLIVLEHPDRAAPVPTQKDEPLESVVPPDRNLLEEAWEVGRPMVVVRLGDTQVSEEELQSKAIPGTILLPGDKFLGPPALAPCVPYKLFRVTDPLHGLRWYPEEECLKDGGDVPPHLGYDRDGKLGGLDPKDTVAEYSDSHGNRRLTVSNRVCLCVPRYIVIRTAIAPAGYEIMIGPSHAQVVDHQVVLKARLPSLAYEQVEGPELLRNRERPQVMQEAITAVTYEQWLSTALVIGEIGTQVVIGTSVKKPCPQERPLLLCKEVDKHCTSIGDVVTFTLRYTNPGEQPISNIVLNDSLTGRLEYVPGSAKSDRDAVFTTQSNAAGSLILRWEIQGPLPPGQSGIVTFQAKIR